MARTSSGGISNSAAKQFSNCEGRICKDNLNRVVASANIYDILTLINGQKPLPVNKYPNLHPKSINQVVLNLDLFR